MVIILFYYPEGFAPNIILHVNVNEYTITASS